MSKQKKVVMVLIIMAIFLMGIGYAALTTTTVTITGSATAEVIQDNFKVYYTGEKTINSNNENANVSVTIAETKTAAVIEISKLNKKDDYAYAILEIVNDSNAVDASSINVTTSGTNDNAGFFDIKVEMCDQEGNQITDYSVKSTEKTYAKVTATLLKTPTDNTVSTSITATITATPKTN